MTEMLKDLLKESSFLSVKERLRSFLLRQQSDIIVLTHTLISDELGLHRVIVSKTLKELEREEYVAL